MDHQIDAEAGSEGGFGGAMAEGFELAAIIVRPEEDERHALPGEGGGRRAACRAGARIAERRLPIRSSLSTGCGRSRRSRLRLRSPSRVFCR